MIRYTPQAQLTLEGFEHPFDQDLDPHNRWVILASVIPWDQLARVYYRRMDAKRGAPTLSARMVIGAVILKHMLNIDDREVVQQITENIYLQYFVGLPSFQKKAPFDASLLVSIRKRLGPKVLDEFNTLVLEHTEVIGKKGGSGKTKGNGEEEKSEDCGKDQNPTEVPSAHCGVLMMDATVSEQQIAFPTDVKLLNASREQLERMVAQVCSAGGLELPRMYRRKARRDYLLLTKKRNKSVQAIRRALRQQLQYVRRDLGYLDGLMEDHPGLRTALDRRDWKLLQVIHELYRQQRQMYQSNTRMIGDRIVNIYQPHVRPMKTGKDKGSTEFGSKQLVMLKDGFSHVHTLSWDAFHEGNLLRDAVEAYKGYYGCYPEAVSADKLFGTRENRRYMKEVGIRFIGKALGRPTALAQQEARRLKQEMGKRNAIEGKFGQGKNAYGLGKIRAQLKETSESWIVSIYFVMNLVKLAEAERKRLFLAFFSRLYATLQDSQQGIVALLTQYLEKLGVRILRMDTAGIGFQFSVD